MIPTAIILAGGRGSRLAPWPAPKCLMPIRGVTLIERLLQHLEPHVSRVVVCVGYRADDVRAALKHREGQDIAFSDAGEDAQMGERLLRARREHGIDERALVLYGDEIADVSLDALVAHHERVSASMTFTACRQRVPFGTVHGGRIFDDEDVLVNIGFVLVEPWAWRWVQPEDGLADSINRAGGTSFYVHEGRRATVNSLAELEQAEEVWT